MFAASRSPITGNMTCHNFDSQSHSAVSLPFAQQQQVVEQRQNGIARRWGVMFTRHTGMNSVW